MGRRLPCAAREPSSRRSCARDRCDRRTWTTVRGCRRKSRVRSDRRAGSIRSVEEAARLLGTLSIVAGLLLAGWAFVVWQWGDPVTSVYTSWEQRRLDSELATLTRDRPPLPPAVRGETPAEAVVRIRDTATTLPARREGGRGHRPTPRAAARRRHGHRRGNGHGGRCDEDPAATQRTFMPGEGKLVYLAGHRTTYSAPFATIDTLRNRRPHHGRDAVRHVRLRGSAPTHRRR